jgi:hypothetical protein
MERKPEQKIGSLLDAFLKANKLEEGMAEFRLKRAWGELLGKSVSRATKDMYVKDAILFVRMHSSVLRSEIHLIKGDLIRRLNEAAGKEIIKDIVVR